MSIFEDGQFVYTGREAELDSKKRVTLGASILEPAPGVRYRVFQNELGQILLDPVKSVPAYEAWIYENRDRITSIQRGIAQAESGEVVHIELPEND